MALTDDKLAQKRHTLIERTAAALGIPEHNAAALLRIERKQSVRLNTLVASAESTRRMLATFGAVSEVPWAPIGLFIEAGLEAIRDSPLAEDGSIYIQNAASWLPVLVLNPQPGDTVLDMCAAPGGKTSHIAQHTDNAALITANDNSRPRLHKLQRNLERLGVTNTTYTLHDATRLSSKLGDQQFDKILLDAPCSGEGMMTLDDKKSFESWSVAHIKRLQQLQKKLIVQAWRMLKPGGTLVYSTCTMAPEENEAVIDYLLRHNDDIAVEPLDSIKAQLDNSTDAVTVWNDRRFDERVSRSLRLTPSPHIEAFFVVKLTKLPHSRTIL